ncbi:hypothetical protein A3C23_00360 [Candidatus Roizmanbacteria bacterium RIFCSPHIGHO2_02_FULL_37_13b]|uniref:Uncharacterized protein n=1 Tax=Candidatus Roizmanbacteria bacterium RIFCSPLOWO2_02_FULL_36_11 TaxID=1802071 RepID=A0A1F7JBJ5_9BACT|nr:MAG: hypothetical protein A3C23_00360 [Candidatus Roizmanbacteria bacterium RIFCSPHIGHO2_02_FULL_37_13b]OGK52955.1 MAG: hypothetical protein A3H78_02470 [Candidatus Roizmanbacteria bacterium RIFCSPLOWO2_02_FULL_36_11]
MNQKVHGIAVLVVTVLTYLFTVHPMIRPLTLKFFVFYCYFTFFGSFYYFAIRSKNSKTNTTSIFIYLLTATALLLVGATGWFRSPFFYMIYLLAIFYSHIFSRTIALVFVFVITGLLIPEVARDSFLFDNIRLLTLLLIVPVVEIFQNTFLNLKEQQKKILILESSKTDDKTDVVGQITGNKVHRLAFHLRARIGDIKQFAFLLKKNRNSKKTNIYGKDIVDISDEMLTEIDKFEKQTTGEKIAHKK